MESLFFAFRIFLLSVSLFTLRSFGSKFRCPGIKVDPKSVRHCRIEPSSTGRVREEYSKIRIKLFFESSIQDERFKELFQQTADFWSNALSVKPINGRIFKSRGCKPNRRKYIKVKGFDVLYCLDSCTKVTKCHGFQVPAEHLDGCKFCNMDEDKCYHRKPKRGAGIENADFVLYIAPLDPSDCDDKHAVTAVCEFEPTLDRPVFANINICNLNRAYDEIFMLNTIKHEMMHALGFGYHRLFKDKDGQNLWPEDEDDKESAGRKEKVLKIIERDWDVRGGQVIKSKRVFLVTPHVVREAQAHFNCTALEGAELENSGGEGTEGSHWEARVFHEDEMTGAAETNSVFSRLDFALLEDSGWYQVNYSQAQRMNYGRNLGCDFCMKSCKYWMDKKRNEGKSVEPFCDQTAEQSSSYLCNKANKVYSGCPLIINNDPVPMKYQYFDKLEGVDDNDLRFYSGSDSLADFCPIPRTGYITSCNEQPAFEELLSHIMKPRSNIPLEGFGIDSYCFESRTNWTVKEYKDTCSQVETFSRGQNAGCYKYSCLSGLLVLKVSNILYPCFFEGQVLEISLFGPIGNATHVGTIVCPSCSRMCGQSSNFKCKPENPNLAFEYPYFKDECIDSDSLEKKIGSSNKEGNKWTTVAPTINTEATDESNAKKYTHCPPNQSSTLVPISLIKNLLTFVIIKTFT